MSDAIYAEPPAAVTEAVQNHVRPWQPAVPWEAKPRQIPLSHTEYQLTLDDPLSDGAYVVARNNMLALHIYARTADGSFTWPSNEAARDNLATLLPVAEMAVAKLREYVHGSLAENCRSMPDA